MSIFRILKDNVDYQIFDLEELKEEDWNPLVYNQSLANSLYLLVARDFDTPEKRIPNLRKRMEGIPAVIAQAKANLKHPPKIHTETAIEQMQGAISFVREGLESAARSRAADEEGARTAAGENRARARGIQEMAAERFAAALRRRFPARDGQVPEETPFRARLRSVGGRTHETRAGRPGCDANGDLRNRAAALQKIFPERRRRRRSTDKKKVTTAVLDKLAEQHPDDNTIVATAQKVVTEATEFVRKKESRHAFRTSH